MKLLIKAKPNAKVEKIEELKGTLLTKAGRAMLSSYKVSIKATPTDGKANDAIILLLARHFKVAPARVRIISGHSASQKIVEIN